MRDRTRDRLENENAATRRPALGLRRLAWCRMRGLTTTAVRPRGPRRTGRPDDCGKEILMLLMAAETNWMPKVFMVYGAFWVTVLIVLYVVVGLLLRKQGRHDDSSHGGHGPSH